MIGYSTVTSKGQITLPASIRKSLGLTLHSEVVIKLDEEAAKVIPADSFFRLRGSIKSQKRAQPRKMQQQFIKYLSRRRK